MRALRGANPAVDVRRRNGDPRRAGERIVSDHQPQLENLRPQGAHASRSPDRAAAAVTGCITDVRQLIAGQSLTGNA